MEDAPTPAPDQRRHFFECDERGVREWATSHGMPAHAATQLLAWVYGRGVTDPGLMTNLSKAHRALIDDHISFLRSSVAAAQVASDGTQKLLLGWDNAPQSTDLLPVLQDGARRRETECVMIPSEDRRTACVSSQVGCPVGCSFCASGIGGLEGNLTSGQIVEQVWRLARLDGVQRITNVVFMGMGEPLANYSAVTDAIRTINAPWGMGIGARRITLSTVGLPAAIRKFCEFELPVTLALSLHAPNDELRRTIIPWAQFSTVTELLDACQEWFHKTGREITIEYILLGGVNDAPEHAAELAAHARSIHANVNLIRYNEVRGMPYSRPSSERVHAFQEVLRSRGVNAHIRASRGRDIAAACGQLRHERTQGRTPA